MPRTSIPLIIMLGVHWDSNAKKPPMKVQGKDIVEVFLDDQLKEWRWEIWGQLEMSFRWKEFVVFSFSVSQCCVLISVSLLGVEEGAGCAVIAPAPAAPGIREATWQGRAAFHVRNREGKITTKFSWF